MQALPPFPEELRPGLLGLADEDHVGETLEIVLHDRDERPADDGEHAPVLEIGQDFLHPMALDAHPGDPDDVGAGTAIVVDRFDVLVHEGDGVALRREGRE